MGDGEGEWKEIKGRDLLLKVVESKKTGEDAKQVTSDDTVLLQILGRQSDGPSHVDGPVFQDTGSKSLLVKVDERDLTVRAIRECLPHCRVGQTVHIWSTAQYALQDGTRKWGVGDKAYRLPPNSTVLYQLTVTQIVMDTSRLNPYFTIQRNKTRKKIANDLYQCEFRSQRERAVRLYEKTAKEMAKLLDGTYFASVESDHPQRKETRQLFLDSLNNVVAVYMGARQYKKGREAVQQVLRYDPRNKKALLRNAKMAVLDPRLTGKERAQAVKDAENVITYHDSNEYAELQKLQAQLKKAVQQAKEKSPTDESEPTDTSTASTASVTAVAT